ncbi:MAG: glycosyltransferase family 39 protein, partial [Chloroflexia bacterium]
MASIGEVGSTTSIASPPEPATQPDLIVPEATSAIPVESPTIEVKVTKTPAPRNKALKWLGGALRRLWMSRGFFGGLIAMYLAFNAQRNLIDRGTWEVSQRLYLAAFVILILSLMHPTFEFFRRKPKAKVATTPVIVELTSTPTLAGDILESTVVLEPHLNGSIITNGEHSQATNGSVAGATEISNGNGHVEAETLNDLEVIAPLPTRRAGRRVSLDTAALSDTMPVATESLPLSAVVLPAVTELAVAEPEVIVAPIAPSRPRIAPKARHSTRPLDESEVPASVLASSSRKRRFSNFKTSYFDLRASLGWKATLPLFLVTVGLAVWLYFLFQQDITSSLFGWMWFATMMLMVATFYGAPRWPRALQGLLDGPDEGFFARGVPRIPVKLETALVLIMLVGALAIRLWNLEYLPGIFGDEGERGLDARGILHGNTDPIFGAGWWVVPNVYFYILSWSLRIFGDNLIGDRMLSVICGMLVIFLIYKIGRLLWGARAGLIAGSLLAISPIWIMFSRHASESTPTVTCWVIGFYFLFRALRFRQWVDWVLAGMGFGFSLYFYASGKLVVPLLLAVGGYMLVRWRLEFFKRYAAGFALLLGTFMLTFLPHFVWLQIGRFEGFFLRANETSIFAPGHAAQVFGNFSVAYDPALANLSVVDNLLRAPGPWALVIWNQFRISFDVLYRVSGGSTFFYQLNDHNGTLLTPVIACLCLLGMAYGLWKLWDARYGIALVWFVVGLAGVAFTMDTPHVQRIVGSWPVLMIFPAVMIDRVLASAWPLNIKFARRWLTIPVIGL